MFFAPLSPRHESGAVFDDAIDRGRKIFQKIGPIVHSGYVHSAIERELGDRQRAMSATHEKNSRTQILRFDHHCDFTAADRAKRVGFVFA